MTCSRYVQLNAFLKGDLKRLKMVVGQHVRNNQ